MFRDGLLWLIWYLTRFAMLWLGNILMTTRTKVALRSENMLISMVIITPWPSRSIHILLWSETIGTFLQLYLTWPQTTRHTSGKKTFLVSIYHIKPINSLLKPRLKPRFLARFTAASDSVLSGRPSFNSWLVGKPSSPLYIKVLLSIFMEVT